MSSSLNTTSVAGSTKQNKPIQTFALFKDPVEINISVDEEGAEEQKRILRVNDITASAVSHSILVVGDAKGQIHLRNMNGSTKNNKTKVSLFAGPIHVLRFFNMDTNLKTLVAIGEDLSLENSGAQQSKAKTRPVIKMLELDSEQMTLKPKSNSPKSFNLLPEELDEDVNITAVDINESDSLMAVGLDVKKSQNYYGHVMVYKTDAQRFVLLGRLNVSTLPTGLGFCKHDQSSYTLFVSTEDRVYKTSVSTTVQKAIAVDTNGCKIGCAIMNPGKGEFILANRSGVYKYRDDQSTAPSLKSGMDDIRGEKVHSHQLQKDPIHVSYFGSSYIILVTHNELDPQNLDSKQIFTIYNFGDKDQKEKYKAYEKVDSFRISNIILEPRKKQLYIVAENKVLKLEEKDTASKIEFLIKKYKYKLAIKEAEEHNSQQYNETYVTETKQKHGDYLFSKEKYARAVQQYCETIGTLEPSYVIRKFLDSKKNEYLIQYLEALHMKNQYNNDHTTLLLNCYTRLRDSNQQKTATSTGAATTVSPTNATGSVSAAGKSKEKTDIKSSEAYVRQRIRSFLFPKGERHYDPRTAIEVLRKVGYRDIALELAMKIEGEKNPNITTNDLIVKIHIEDFNDDSVTIKDHYTKALQHIETLPFAEARDFLKQYAKILLTRLPYSTTNLLIRLCTKQYQPINQQNKDTRKIKKIGAGDEPGYLPKRNEDNESVLAALAGATNDDIASPKEFLYAFADQSFWLMVFLENVIHRTKHMYNVDHPSIVYNTLLELYLKYWEQEELTHSSQSVSSSSLLSSGDADYYAELLKQVTKSVEKQHHNLIPDFELMHEYEIGTPGIEKEGETKSTLFASRITHFLEEFASHPNKQNSSFYDREHALMLLQSTKKKLFKKGILFMYKLLNLHYDILQYHMDEGPSGFEEVIRTCEEYGKKDPNMWVQVLSYFATYNHEEDKALTAQCISTVLQKIQKNNYLPPLLVVQILSENNNTTLKDIKQFLIEKLQAEQQQTKQLSGSIKSYQETTAKLQDEIEELRTSAKVFQLTTCSYCTKTLDLPAVHFMCMHSFHQRCLADDVEQCKKCAVKNQQAVATAKGFEDAKSPDEDFFKYLANAQDGFSVVAQYFGRGIFKPSIFQYNPENP